MSILFLRTVFLTASQLISIPLPADHTTFGGGAEVFGVGKAAQMTGRASPTVATPKINVREEKGKSLCLTNDALKRLEYSSRLKSCYKKPIDIWSRITKIFEEKQTETTEATRNFEDASAWNGFKQ